MYDKDELNRCHEEIRRLKAENMDLRRASETFGYLAERLNLALRAERRLRDTDRRQVAREAPDRRTG
jgi:broad specificity phosphatase PhoE